jgi:type II secretion system protein D
MQGTRTVICSVVLVLASLVQAESASQPAATQPASAPAAQPASQPKPAPTPAAAAPASKPQPEPTFVFQFAGAPYTDVVRRFAQALGKPLIGDLNIEGELHFTDEKAYTASQAQDVLNLLLAMRGYVLRPQGRFLRLMPLADVPGDTRILRGLAEAQSEDVSPGEIVTMVLPLKFLDPDEASKSVIRLVSPFGSISPLPGSRAMAITDRLDNIRRIDAMLQIIDTRTVVDKELKTVSLTHASAQTAAGLVNSMFGAQQQGNLVYDPKQKKMVPRQVDAREIVTTSFDDRTNVVVLLGTPERLAMAEEMLRTLDQAKTPSQFETRIFQLGQAQAADLARTIGQLLPPPPKGQQPPRLAPQANTNRLVVSAPAEQLTQIASLIAELDTASKQTEGLKIVELKHADANHLAHPLHRSLARRDERGRLHYPVHVHVIPGTNQLILTGPQAELNAAMDLLARLDTEAVAEAREVHVIQLASGDAYHVARSLSRIFNTPGQTARLVVEAERDTNSLMISASPDDWPEIRKTLDDLQQTATEIKTPVTRIVPLAHVKAGALARTLQRAVASRHWGRRGAGTVPIFIHATPGDDALLITAAPSEQQQVAALIETLDKPTENIEPMTMVSLTSAKADELANRLRSLLPEAHGRDATVFIQADPATNTVLLRAPQARRQAITDLIDKLDKATLETARETRMVQLTNTSAAALAQTLQQLYPRPGRGVAPIEAVIITAAPSDQSLLIEAARSRVDEVVQLAETLDAKDKTQPIEVRIYQVDEGSADDVARTLGNLFARQNRRRHSVAAGEPAPRFEFNQATSQVLVAATPDQFERIDKLMQKIQSAGRLAQQTRTFQLQYAQADELVRLLQTVLPDQTTGRRRGRQGNALRVAAMPTANAVVVQAQPDKLALAEQIITTFDTKAASERTTIRVVQLKKAQAETLARSVGQTLETRGADGVAVTAETNSNSVLVRGPAERVDEVLAMIRKLDADSTSEDVQVYVYPLKNANAKQLAGNLEQMFRALLRQLGRRGESVFSVAANDRTNSLLIATKPASYAMVEKMLRDLDQTDQAARDVEYIVLRSADVSEVSRQLYDMFRDRPWNDRPVVQMDRESNALTLIGTETDLATMAKVVTKLDTAAARAAVRVRVVPLDDVDAKKMAEMIRRLYAQMTDSPIVVAENLTAAQTQPATQPTAQPAITIAYDTTANTLLLSGPKRDLDEIESLVSQLSWGTNIAEAEYRVFTVAKASPVEVARTLDELFNPQDGNRRRRAEPNIVAVPETRTRSVIVKAKPTDFAAIEPLIAKIDSAGGDETYFVKVYALSNARAPQAAAALQQTFLAEPGRHGRGQADTPTVRISPEPSSNTLVVRADKADHAKIADLIKEIDISSVAELPVRMIPLRHADPAPLAAMLNRLYAPRNRRQGSEVRIEADADARTLMIRADDESFEKIRKLATTLDASSTVGQANQTLLRLEHAQADTVAASLQQAFLPRRGQRITAEDLVTVVAEPASNSLIVTANEPNLKKVRALVDQLDTEEAGTVKTEFFLLTNAQATDLAAVLQRVTGATGRRGRGQAGPELRISAEPASNALVLSGPASQVSEMMQMAIQLDQAAQATTPGVYIIPLDSGDAESMVAMIRDLHNQQRAAARRTKNDVEPLAVSADARANAIVLASSKDMYEQVQQWVRHLEQMKPRRGEVRVIPLEHADPAEVQKAIDQLNGQAAPAARPGRRAQAGSSPFEVTVLPRQQAIMVTGSDADFQAIQKLIETLEASARKTQRTSRIIVLKHANPQRVVQALAPVLRTTRYSQGQQPPSISAMADSNAVVVAATKEQMDEVGKLIQQLDSPEVAQDLTFRVFTLTNAQPTKIVPTLQRMLRQLQRAHPGTQIDVQADERTRALIITAKEGLFDQIARLVETLDKAPAYAQADVLIIPLRRADATQLARVLQDMLRPDGNQITAEARALQEQVRLLQVRSTMKETLPPLDLTKPIKIDADPARPQGTNSLILSSTPKNLDALAAIVDVLDTVPLTAGVKVKLIHLTNADAVSVRDILRDVFAQGRRLAGQPGQSTAGRAEPESTTGKALVKTLNISADTRTNSLILSGEEDVLALADLLVKDLDREKGKVVTEIRLFRLDHADATRLAPTLQAVFAERGRNPAAEGVQTQVTRLRTHLAGKDGKADLQESDFPKLHPALSIRAEGGTNMLVVAARSDVMPLIADVVKSMDIPGAGSMNQVRIFPLVHADATRLDGVIRSLYTGPNAKLVRDEDRPTVAVDTRTNSLIVSASEKTFSMLTTLLGRLDAKTPVELRDLRLLPLENAEALTVASILQRMMDARVQRQQSLGLKDAEALRTVILADARSNSLIVGGSTESFQIVRDLATKLDTASPALAGQVQVLPLEEGNAATIATTLSRLFAQRYQAARTAEIKRQRPVILPDLRTNSLLVAATADDSKILKSLLQRLDVKLTDPAVQLTVIPLEYNDAGVIGPEIGRLFAARLRSMTPADQTPSPQDRVDVAIDSLSNSLIVSASKENLGLIRELLAKVDVAPADETGVVRMYPLKHADAQRVATMLRGLLDQGLYKPGLVGSANQAATIKAREKVSLAVDARMNVLIVSASRENFSILEQIIAKVDSDESFGLLGDIQVFPLKHADAARLAPTLQAFFRQKRAAEESTGSTGRSLPVVVLPDSRTNALLVAGSRESFAAVKNIIARLDTDDSAPATDFRVFELKHATAQRLQGTLQKLFDDRTVRGQGKDKVSILADPRSNTLIVGATPDEMELVASMVHRLDKPSDDDRQLVKIYPLAKADAVQALDTLKSLYRSGGGDPNDLSLTADERINAIIVSAGVEDQKRIAQLVDQLDRDKVTRVTEIRVFPLDNADAEELAALLMDVLTEKPKALTKVSPNRQTLLQFIRRTPAGKNLITSALQEGVLITPDKRTNALVVSAPLDNMPLLSSMISSLDSASPRAAEIRVFALQNADAARMAEVLAQLFRFEDKAGTDREGPAVKYTLADGQLASATTGQVDQASLNITVDTRTNSLLIGGSPEQLDMAAAVITRLDASPGQERVTRVYRPKNAQASNIEKTVRAFLDQERQRLVSTLGKDNLDAAQRMLEREVAVVAEEESNTLLLSASPRYFQTLGQMIEELDQPPAQVLVQALLAEVRLDNDSTLGVDWGWQTTYRSNLIEGGSNMSVRASLEAGNPIGFNVSVTGGDLNFFLRALQQQNRVEVLSRPQILAANNQSALIEVGQRVPLITNSRVTDQGDTINTITYEQIGVQLEILPRIGSDGSVRMEVKPTISSVSKSFTPITQFAEAPYINNRAAQTTVTCQDGQTIIIGGLITTTDEDREDKVPILGDIPLMGLLFRNTTKTKNRSELLIFLTPHILRNGGDQNSVTTRELKDNDTLRSLKMNHPYKDRALDTFTDEALRDMVNQESRTLPDTNTERRLRNVHDTVIELELLPEEWIDETWKPGDPAPVEKEVE